MTAYWLTRVYIQIKMAFKFENLRVWNRSLELGHDIRILARTFPAEEKFGLCSQIIRATDSIGLNIAEGSTGQTNPEFKRFLNMALRSAIEVIACLRIALKNLYLTKEEFNQKYQETENLIIQIQALKNSLK